MGEQGGCAAPGDEVLLSHIVSRPDALLAHAAAVTELGDATPALEPLQSRSGLMADIFL